MSEYILSCSSGADVTTEWLRQRNMECINFHYRVGDEDMVDDLWTAIKPRQLYERMVAGESAKTSQINIERYMNYFEGFVKEGKDVFHATLSSGISGTYNSAVLAARNVMEEYRNQKIVVVDSLAASSGYGLLMDLLYQKKESGASINELKAYYEDVVLNVRHFFFSSDLTFYIRGGRVSKTAGVVGTLLNICPLLDVDYKGRLIVREKVRTKKKVITRIVEKMQETVAEGADYDNLCYMSHSDCYEDACAVRDLVEERFPKLKGKIQMFDIGPTIGCHTGPGTVTLFYVGTKRVD